MVHVWTALDFLVYTSHPHMVSQNQLHPVEGTTEIFGTSTKTIVNFCRSTIESVLTSTAKGKPKITSMARANLLMLCSPSFHLKKQKNKTLPEHQISHYLNLYIPSTGSLTAEQLMHLRNLILLYHQVLLCTYFMS